jgi:hypothetical protein
MTALLVLASAAMREITNQQLGVILEHFGMNIRLRAQERAAATEAMIRGPIVVGHQGLRTHLYPECPISSENSLVSHGIQGAAIEMLDAFVEDDRRRHEELRKLVEHLQPHIYTPSMRKERWGLILFSVDHMRRDKRASTHVKDIVGGGFSFVVFCSSSACDKR